METYDRRALKQQAKDTMKTTRPSVFVTAIIYLIIVVILSYLSSRLGSMRLEFEELEDMMKSMDTSFIINELADHMPKLTPFEVFLTLLLSLMGSVITAGYQGYCLKVSRGEEVKHMDIFCSFDHFLKVICIVILEAIFIFLWSLLFIIPGIIAAFRYSQAYYIMFEHPEYSARRCLRESSKMMKGWKWNLFVLLLSFIGWAFLNAVIKAFLYVGFLSIYIEPFIGITNANFHNLVSGWKKPDEMPPVWEPDV